MGYLIPGGWSGQHPAASFAPGWRFRLGYSNLPSPLAGEGGLTPVKPGEWPAPILKSRPSPGGFAPPSPAGGEGRKESTMFETLSDRLTGIFDKLTGRGALSEADVDTAMREVRRALLEADVALEVVKSFIDKVREKAVGADVVKSIKPGQMVVKIVHDELVAVLGSDQSALNLRASPPRCYSHGGFARFR